jgi:zinc carboxypeptidase
MKEPAINPAGPFLRGAAFLPAEEGRTLQILTDFPGGSARVQGIDQETRTVRLVPTPHPDRGWACWWYFKLQGVRPGETITLEVGTDSFAKPDQAMFSLDNHVWVHTAPGRREKDRIIYHHRVDATDAWFAWGPPYVLEHARALVERAAKVTPDAIAFELCKSREGRPVPALRFSPPGVTNPGAAARAGIWIQARQHAWESGSSWVGQGLVEWLLSEDPRAAELRKKAEICFVPIMDVDNVARGAGGKNQKPQDHNRDWSESPHWPEVRAAMQHIAALNAAGRFDLFIDLHNPAPNDRVPEFFLPPRELLSARGKTNLERFLAAATEEMKGPLAFTGKTRDTGPKYDPNWERISKTWIVRRTRDHVVAVTLETSWNTPHSTQEGYRRVGRELGLAIERYFRSPVREPG